jgi:hypothetical protein
MNAPDATPAAPKPAMARPTIRAVLLGATAHMRLPSSKMKTASRYVHFRGKYLKALPQGEVKDATVRKKAEPYHPIWETLWNSSVIFGIAVATIVWRDNQQVSWNWRIKEGIPSPARP